MGRVWRPGRRLQSPVVGWAVRALRGGYIHLGNCQVDFHGVQFFMPQDALQLKDVAAIAQKVNGKGMAEPVRKHIIIASVFIGKYLR